MRPKHPASTFIHRTLSLVIMWTFISHPVVSQVLPPSPGDPNRPIAKQFQWKFANDGLGASLPACLPLGIIVQPWDVNNSSTFGIPPYYMISYAIGGTPQTSFIGTENRTLEYTIRHPPGTKLMLSVVDASGSGGGIPPRLYDVITGQSLQCIPANSTEPAFTITANVTDEVKTCEPWGLTIKGGSPPYNLTLAAVNSPVVTNVTIPFGFDAFTYINRAPPGTQLIAAVSDLNGRWASGTPIVSTSGSTDDLCPGLNSASGDSKALGHDKPRRRSNTAVIAGVTVPLVVLALVGAGFAFWWFRRRRQRQRVDLSEKGAVEDPLSGFTNVTPFDVSGMVISGPDSLGGRSNYQHSDSKGIITLSNRSNDGPPYSPLPVSDRDASTASSSRTRPSFVAFPAAPTRRSKAEEAASVSPTTELDSEYSSSLLPPLVERSGGGQEIIIQHRDGGSAPPIRELPPPYADRGARGGENSSAPAS